MGKSLNIRFHGKVLKIFPQDCSSDDLANLDFYGKVKFSFLTFV